jgi:predicted GNAT family acetyltransferase
MTGEPLVVVDDRVADSEFVVTVDGETAGVATYRLRGDQIIFIHTEVLPAFGGRGLGALLAAGALDDARRRGLRVRPFCPFIAKFIREHAEYQDLLVAKAAP